MSNKDDDTIMTRQELAQMKAAAKAEGRREERARIRAISGSEAAKGREKQAIALALDTGLEPAEAVAVLAAAPTEGTSALSLATRQDGIWAAPKARGACGSAWDGVHEQTAKSLGMKTGVN